MPFICSCFISSALRFGSIGQSIKLCTVCFELQAVVINDNIKIVFLGGTKNHLRIMIDAPKEVNIVRSTVLENQITDPEERAKLPKYYAEEEHPEKYRKKSNVIITKGNADK